MMDNRELLPGSDAVVRINSSLKLAFQTGQFAGGNISGEDFEEVKLACEAAQERMDSSIISKKMSKFEEVFDTYGYGWKELRRGLTQSVMSKNKANGGNQSRGEVVQAVDNEVDVRVETPFYEEINLHPVEYLHYFQAKAQGVFAQLGETGANNRSFDGRKLLFYLEAIQYLQDRLQDSPHACLRYVQALRSEICREVSALDENRRNFIVSYILPVIDGESNEFSLKATDMGESRIPHPRERSEGLLPSIEKLLGLRE